MLYIMKENIAIFVFWMATFVNSIRVDHSLSTYVNFEKYFTIEEELITLADLFLKHELRSHDGEDVHDILNMTSTIETAKALHRDIGLSYRDYIKHPVNTFHLTKRLATGWRDIVNRLLESSACVKDLRVKLQNMEDNIPEKKDFKKVAYSLTNLHLYGGLSLDDIVKGNINGYAPKHAFSLEDISDIGHAAYDREDYYYAYNMLTYVFDKMKSNRMNELENGISIGNQASRLASVCYKMGHIDKAKAVLSELLKMDSKNKLAKRNLEYYMALTKKSKSGEPKRKEPSRKSQRYFQNMCLSKTPEMLSKSTKLQCLYFPHRKQDVPYQKSNVKAEVLHKTPLIVKFYDVVNNDTAKAISFMAYKQMSESMVVGYKSSLQSVAVKDRTFWKWVPKLQTKILSLKMSKFLPKITSFMVNEVGIDGYIARNNSKTKYPPVGTYLTFLSDSSLGGEVIFPLSKLKIPVSKGDMLFYDNHAKVMICPVLHGSQWCTYYNSKFATRDMLTEDVPLSVEHAFATPSIWKLMVSNTCTNMKARESLYTKDGQRCSEKIVIKLRGTERSEAKNTY